MSDATTRILQRPQVRATDGGKASLLIGSSIPYVTGSLNSAVATPGAIPYATTQFQQVNVGTQIEFAPHVNGPEDISMHVKVELSNVLQTETIAGVEQPIIGKQTDEADIRMKDGEVSVLGGLSDRENSATISGLPGVTNMPVLGYLLGSKKKSTTDNEILIAMIPHIVRPPDLSAGSGEGVYAGTERVVRVERAAPRRRNPRQDKEHNQDRPRTFLARRDLRFRRCQTRRFRVGHGQLLFLRRRARPFLKRAVLIKPVRGCLLRCQTGLSRTSRSRTSGNKEVCSSQK